MKTIPKNIITPSAETRPLAYSSATGNGAGHRFRRLWMTVVMAMALATILLSSACGSAGETEPLKLVPEGATLITEIEVAEILDKVDLDSLVDALPDEEDVPQTIDEVFDLVITATGIDLRKVSRAIFFGDQQREDDYFGLIVRGFFDEEGMVAAIQQAEGGSLSTESYKSRDLHIPQDDTDSFAFTLLDQETLLLGSPDAVRHVIDVQEGDLNRAEGNVNAALNDLPRGLIRMVLAVPPGAFQNWTGVLEGFLVRQEIFGELPISLEPFNKLEMFGFALGQDGDTLKIQVRLDFADHGSASTVGEFLDGILKVAGSLIPENLLVAFLDRVQVDHSGNTLTLRLDIVTEELKELLEGLFTITSEESGEAEVTVRPRSIGPGEEADIMPTRNHVPEGQSVAYSTTPPTSGDHWERWADCGFYPDGLPDEVIVHNLEHGNIVVSYNLLDQRDTEFLRSVLATIPLAEEWGVTRFYDKIPEGMVAVVAWGRRARMPGFDPDGLAGFFAAYAGAVGPERIAC